MRKVRLKDYSYSLIVEDGKLTHNIFSVVKESSKRENEYYVLADNCVLPADEGCCGNDRPNDIILQHIPTGTIVFTQERFTAPTYEYCPHCGKIIKERSS